MKKPQIELTVTKVVAAGNTMGARRADLYFHRNMCPRSGYRQAIRAFEGIPPEVRMLIATVDERLEGLKAPAIDHLPLIEAIRSRDPSRAAEALHAHLTNSGRNVSNSTRARQLRRIQTG